MQLAILSLLLVFATAAAAPAGDIKQVALNQEFEIRVGEQVLIEGAGLKIDFQMVAADSRCPKNVKCVWAGNGKVLLKLGKMRKGSVTMSLNTMLDPKHDSYRGYDVKLVKLDPYPEKAGVIKKSDYVATLVVTRK